jgi:hypothetical protein
MLNNICPKLPMRNKKITRDFYLNKLNFKQLVSTDFDGYLMVEKDNIEIHFFEYNALNLDENYGQVYIRANNIDNLYQTFLDNKIAIHPNGQLELKPWNQKEFSVLDPDKNLLTFGECV